MRKFLFFILFLLNVVLMVGCVTQQPTTNTSSRNDSIVVRTEYVHDTTLVERIREIYNAPDTLYIHDSTIIYKYRDRVKTDTLYRYHTDTTVIVQEKLVEKPIAPFVKNSCIALWCILGVAILALVGWIIWKFATGKFTTAGLLGTIAKWFIRKWNQITTHG